MSVWFQTTLPHSHSHSFANPNHESVPVIHVTLTYSFLAALLVFCLATAGLSLPPREGVELKELNDDNFETLTQMTTGSTTGPWFIMFFAPVFPDSSLMTVVVRSLQEAGPHLGEFG